MANILPNKLMMTHDPLVAFEQLVKSAQCYTRWWQGEDGRRIAKAAIAFTAQVAIEYGYDVETIRAMERDLMERMEEP